MKRATTKMWDNVLSHWEENLELARMGSLSLGDISSRHCAFCAAYVWEGSCSHLCPVRGHTGQGGCVGTPWTSLSDLLWSEGVQAGEPTEEEEEQIREATKEELEFLRGLRSRYWRMKDFRLYWAPEKRAIATVSATSPGAACRKAPYPYSKFLGEIYAEEI